MSVLTDLKAAAAADLASTKSTVSNYVKALEAAASAAKPLLIGVGAGCLVAGWAVGHLMK